MGKKIDLSGLRFGKLVAVEHIPSTADENGKRKASAWLCNCDCGGTRTVVVRLLLNGKIYDCQECHVDKRATLDLPKMSHPDLYSVWRAMHRRCSNENDSHYHRYGGRGIRVCNRWFSFANFVADMFPRPAGMSIDRVDNDGPYSPDNCRWADAFTQAQNSSLAKQITVDGKTLCVAEWCRVIGINRRTVTARVKSHPDGFEGLISDLLRERRAA